MVSQMNIGTVSNVALGKLMRWSGAHTDFSEHIDTIVN